MKSLQKWLIRTITRHLPGKTINHDFQFYDLLYPVRFAGQGCFHPDTMRRISSDKGAEAFDQDISGGRVGIWNNRTKAEVARIDRKDVLP